jgi:DNA polymerase
MSIITLDFETHYSKTYSLSKMTTEAYIRSPDFQVIGFAFAIGGGVPTWFSGTDEWIARSLHDLDLANHQLLCHHTAFDGAILGWRYNIYPKLYLDTKSMAKPITGHTKVGASLAKLATHFNLGRKGTEVVDALGKRREDFNYADLHQYGEYCKNDVALTRDLFNVLYPSTTKKELYVIDLMLRMFTDPALHFDKPLLETHLVQVQERKAQFMAKLDAAISQEDLMSNPKLASVLQKLGVEPPTKISPSTGKETWAFAQSDQAFKDLLEHDDLRVQAVIGARLKVKSTLEETRTDSFIGIAERGALPVMLNYYGAATGRASGGDKMNFQNLPRGPLRHWNVADQAKPWSREMKPASASSRLNSLEYSCVAVPVCR